jgi:DNA-binding SARP family transcriptional activator
LITRERELLRLLAIEGLDRLITSHLAQGNYPAGITVAMRLLEMDNLREETYRKLMDLLARSGQRTQALEQYNRLCKLLDEEFGLMPLPEIVTLCEEIRAGIVPRGSAQFETVTPVISDRLVALTNPYKGLCAFEEHDADDFRR